MCNKPRFKFFKLIFYNYLLDFKKLHCNFSILQKPFFTKAYPKIIYCKNNFISTGRHISTRKVSFNLYLFNNFRSTYKTKQGINRQKNTGIIFYLS